MTAPEQHPASNSEDRKRHCRATCPDEEFVRGVWQAHLHACTELTGHLRTRDHHCACGAAWTLSAADPEPTSKPAPTSANAGSSGLREVVEREVDAHVDRMAEYAIPAGSRNGFLDGYAQALRLLRRDAEVIADRVVAARPDDLAKVRAEAKVEALREAADKWTQGEWANAPRSAERAQDRIGAANYVGKFLRDRADRIEAGEQP